MTRSIVFAFDGFQPPTIRSSILVNKVVSEARKTFSEHRIFTTSHYDPDENPIPFGEKVHLLRQLFPIAEISSTKNITEASQVIKQLQSEGFEEITFVGGESDLCESIYLGDYGLPSSAQLREYVRDKDFKSFMKNCPTDNIILGRKLFVTLERNLSRDKLMLEGRNDPAIFKAVFLAGGSGSGKDYILSQILDGYGFVNIDSDKAFEHMMRREGFSFQMPSSERIERDKLRAVAKGSIALKKNVSQAGRLGLIINGTADDVYDVAEKKRRLEELGYETRMLFVEVTNEVAKARNLKRAEGGGRKVDEPIRYQKWKDAMANKEHLARLFGQDNFDVIDNNLDMRTASKKDEAEKMGEFLRLYKKIRAWATKRPNTAIVNNWIEGNKRDARSRQNRQ